MLIFWILLVIVAVIIFAAACLCDTVKPATTAYKKMVKKPTWPLWGKDKKNITPIHICSQFIHHFPGQPAIIVSTGEGNTTNQKGKENEEDRHRDRRTRKDWPLSGQRNPWAVRQAPH